jgi:hypothetical protein
VKIDLNRMTRGRRKPGAVAGIALLLAAALAAQPSTAAEEEWRRSNPDVVVYLPKGGEHHDGDNETFLVVPARKSDELIGMWTQSSVEGRGDNRIMLARSGDGVNWSDPVKVVGTTPGTSEPQASWGVPVVVRSGRIYLFYICEHTPQTEDRQVSGGLGVLSSDDNGHTWCAGPDLPVPRNRFDDPDPNVPKKFWFWTTAVRDRKGRWLLGYTQVTSTKVRPKPAREWPHADTRCAFIRFENLDEALGSAEIRTSWLPTDREGLDVPNKMYPQISTCQEPSTALLPDGQQDTDVPTRDSAPRSLHRGRTDHSAEALHVPHGQRRDPGVCLEVTAYTPVL